MKLHQMFFFITNLIHGIRKNRLSIQYFFYKSSTSLRSKFESDFFIDQTFSSLKQRNHLRLIKDKFKFVHVPKNAAETLINKMNTSTSAGHSEIPSKVIKNACKQFFPILKIIFNHCIDIGKFPTEWQL